MANYRSRGGYRVANVPSQVRGTFTLVQTVDVIRRANLLILIKEAGSPAKLSLLTGVPAPYISQVKRAVIHSSGKKPRAIGDDQARKLESKMGKPRGWMDADHSALHVASELNGREGQLIGLFRVLSEAEQTDLVNKLTRDLREQRPADESSAAPAQPPKLRH